MTFRLLPGGVPEDPFEGLDDLLRNPPPSPRKKLSLADLDNLFDILERQAFPWRPGVIDGGKA